MAAGWIISLLPGEQRRANCPANRKSTNRVFMCFHSAFTSEGNAADLVRDANFSLLQTKRVLALRRLPTIPRENIESGIKLPHCLSLKSVKAAATTLRRMTTVIVGGNAIMDGWKRQAQLLQREARGFYFAFKHPRVHWCAKLVAAGTAAYLFSPIQLIPSFIPVVGFLDDLLILFLGVKLLQRIIASGRARRMS